MSKKRELKIDTQFYGEQRRIDGRQIAQMMNTPPYMDDKLTAAANFQRLLSSNLAEKFIGCWKMLKNLLITNQRVRTNIHREDINIGQLKSPHQHSLIKSKYKQNLSNSQPHRKQQKKLSRVRSVDQKLQLSRAQILNKIADKLRQNKTGTDNQDDSDIEVIHRLSKLQKLMKQIRYANQQSQQRAIGSRIQYQKQTKSQEMSRMLEEIKQLKTQIRSIKHYNQQMIKHQIQKNNQSQMKSSSIFRRDNDEQSQFNQQLNNQYRYQYGVTNQMTTPQSNVYNNEAFTKKQNVFINPGAPNSFGNGFTGFLPAPSLENKNIKGPYYRTQNYKYPQVNFNGQYPYHLDKKSNTSYSRSPYPPTQSFSVYRQQHWSVGKFCDSCGRGCGCLPIGIPLRK